MMNTKKELTSSMRKASLVWIIVLAGVCLMLLIPAVWCGRMFKAFRPSAAPDRFPDTDIVYTGGAGLGFVNPDGSGATSFPFKLGYTDFVGTWQSPLLTGDRKAIFVTYTA